MGPAPPMTATCGVASSGPFGLGRLSSPLLCPLSSPQQLLLSFPNNSTLPRTPVRLLTGRDSSGCFSNENPELGFLCHCLRETKVPGKAGKEVRGCSRLWEWSLISSVTWLNTHWWAKLVFLFLPQDQPGLPPVLNTINYRIHFESSVKSYLYCFWTPGKNPNPNKNTAEETT